MTIVAADSAGYALDDKSSMRVLVVDDHREVLDLVERALVRDAHDVAVATSSSEAMQQLALHKPDIVVLDLGLPDGSGEDICRAIRGNGEGPAILILTAENRVASRVRCLDAGADDYLSKPFAIAELRARVRALSRRTRAFAPAPLVRDEVSLDFAARRASRAGKEAPITSREWAILELLAASDGRVVTRLELLDRVWQRRGEAESASLEVLIGRIRRKLGANLIRTVRGEGYALEHG